MVANQAHIDDPEILRSLRAALALLQEECARAVEQGLNDCSRFEHWLRSEQLPTAKRQHLRAEQQYSEARIRYNALRAAPSKLGPQPMDEAERDFRKAKLQLEESSDRLQRMQNILSRFPKEVEQPCAQARMARQQSADQVTRALLRLQQMLDGLDHYNAPGSAAESP